MADQTPSSAKLFGSDRMWGLKELPLPEPVAYWPQTIGWYFVLGLVVVGLALLAWWRWRVWKRNAYRRGALQALGAMGTNPAALSDLPYLLRESALIATRREDVASVRGADWIAWLNRSAGRQLFDDDDADLLDRLPYVPQSEIPVDAAQVTRLVNASKIWVRRHRASV